MSSELTNSFQEIAKVVGIHALAIDLIAEMYAPELPDRERLIRVTMRDAIAKFDVMHPDELNEVTARMVRVAQEVMGDRMREHGELSIPVSELRRMATPTVINGKTGEIPWTVEVLKYFFESSTFYYRVSINPNPDPGAVTGTINGGTFEDPGECLNAGISEAVRLAEIAASRGREEFNRAYIDSLTNS